MFAILKFKAYTFLVRRLVSTNHKDIGSFFFSTIKKYFVDFPISNSNNSGLVFNYEWCFFCFKFLVVGNKNKFYYGISNGREDVSERLLSIKYSCFQGYLLFFIKFENKEKLRLFEERVKTELSNIGAKPLAPIRIYKLTSFARVSDEQIRDIIFSAHFVVGGCLMCPTGHIEKFNE